MLLPECPQDCLIACAEFSRIGEYADELRVNPDFDIGKARILASRCGLLRDKIAQATQFDTPEADQITTVATVA